MGDVSNNQLFWSSQQGGSKTVKAFVNKDYRGISFVRTDSEYIQDEIEEYDHIEDMLTNKDMLPKNGLYRCTIKQKFYQTNHPQDPIEWEESFTILEAELLVL